MTERVTTEALCTAAGCSAATIQRWVRLGLLPAAVRVNAGDGRGVRGWFPSEALALVQEIRLRRARGLTLEEIAVELQLERKVERQEERRRARRRTRRKAGRIE